MTTNRIDVAIFGAAGYGGQELLRLLPSHPHFRAVAVTSQRFEGKSVEEILPQAREQPLEPPQPACEQTMPVAALRHAAAMRRRDRQHVAIDDRDAAEALAQHARRHEAGHAAADDDGVLTQEM